MPYRSPSVTRADRLGIYVLILLAIMTGCQSIARQPKPAFEDHGDALVYAQPFAQEADRLRFSLEGISAMREDGVEFPLALLVSDFSRTDLKRQRLIAAGRLPEGAYSGLLFKVRSASLKTEDGNAALLTQDAPVRRDFPFKVERKKALVLSLALQYAESVTDRVQFRPAWLVSVPLQPIAGLAGYIADHGFNAVTVFDKRKQEVTGVISTGNGPRGMALDRSRNRLYVALSSDDAVEVIDIAEGRSLTSIRLAQGDAPGELALTPDGQTLLAVDTGSDTISFMDTTALVERERIAVGRRPRSLLIERTGRKAYVFNSLSNSISVVDIPGRAVMGEIATGPEPLRGQFNRAGDRLYVAHAEYPYLFVVDPVSFSLVRREFVGTGVRTFKIDTRTDLLYIGKKNEPSIGVYDPVTFSAVDYIPAKGAVDYLAIEGEGNNLYMVISERKTVMIVNLINTRNVSEIDALDGPSWVTMTGER